MTTSSNAWPKDQKPINPFAGTAPLTVLVTGATGFIGKAVTLLMLEAGYEVTALTRNPQKASSLFGGRTRNVRDLDELADHENIDAVINLAGAPVVGPRWSDARKKVLLDSRVGTTHHVLAWLARTQHKPGVWVQASAVGAYGVRPSHEALDEDSATGQGFMSELCLAWEAAAQAATEFGVRQVVLRLGLVFGQGGALPMMLLPYRFALGARLGDGSQMMSWIHHDDVIRIIALAMKDTSLHGIYNAVAPDTVSQAAFAAQAARAAGRPLWLSVPAAPLRLLAGEMGQLFLDGQRVVPTRLLQAGYTFKHPVLTPVLIEATGGQRNR